MTYPSTLRYLGRLWQIVDRTKDCAGRVWVKAKNGGDVLWILERVMYNGGGRETPDLISSASRE